MQESSLATQLQELVRHALSCVRKGDVDAAERVFQHILRQDPNHFDALHLSGVIACQTNRMQHGAALIAKAIDVNAGVPGAHLNLARALALLGKPAEALASYDRAIELDATAVEAFVNRGNILSDLGRPSEALASFDKAIALKPGIAEAHNNRANALGSLGRWTEALAGYDSALAIRPAYAQALANRANALAELGRLNEALESCEQALAQEPGLVHGLINRGNILQALDRPGEALASHDAALALAPDSALALAGRAVALADLGDPRAAMVSVDRCLRLRPHHADGHFIRGYALRKLDRIEEAAASYERAIRDKPDHADAHSNRALCQLLFGQLEEGFRSYEWRKKRKNPVGNGTFPGTSWLGEADIAGKTVLLFSEQGLGDTLQFCRYAPLVERRGAKVVLSAPRRLLRLLRSLSPTIRLIAEDEEPGPVDFHCSLLSLPLAFGTSLETIPADVPYLAADAARVATWAGKLGKDGFKIGICWQGQQGPVDSGRSFPVRKLEALSRIPGVRLVSVQKGHGVEQLRHLPDGMIVESNDAEMDTGSDAFRDTAAILETLDLVITSDTSIAHLAGALGRPTWIVLQRTPDWRWLLHRNDSPWYPSARLFRQSESGDWGPVFDEIEAALKTTLAHAQPEARQEPQARQEVIEVPSRIPFAGCPLCGNVATTVAAIADCSKHALYNPVIPATMTWLRCTACGHVYTDGYLSTEASAVVFDKTHDHQKPGANFEAQRPISARSVERVCRHARMGTWLDVGFGNGSLLFTAREWGFATVGLDLRQSNVDALRQLGFEAHCVDLRDLRTEHGFSVISMADVLEHMPFPIEALAAAHRLLEPDGVLFLSMPNYGCPAWQLLDRTRSNPYWAELEHYHNFSRARLYALLDQQGFEPVGYGVSERYRLGMEVIARRRAK